MRPTEAMARNILKDGGVEGVWIRYPILKGITDTERLVKAMVKFGGLVKPGRPSGLVTREAKPDDIQCECPKCNRLWSPENFGSQRVCRVCCQEYRYKRKIVVRDKDGLTGSDKEVIRRLNKAAGISVDIAIVTGTDAEAAKILDGSLDCEENVSYTPDGETDCPLFPGTMLGFGE